MSEKKESRRRGAELDDAILDAAWAELVEHRYLNFTLEGVAKRAGTSRPVLARRWQNRAQLALAGLQHYLEKRPIVVKNVGNVREELISCLVQTSARGAPAISFMLLSLHDLNEESKIAFDQFKGETPNPYNELLKRAVDRREIDPAKLTERIFHMPLNLVRVETIMTNQPMAVEAVQEIVDSIFLPLVRLNTQ